MLLILTLAYFFLSLNAQARGANGDPCPCEEIQTDANVFLIASIGDSPAIVSNRIDHLPFLTSRQIRDIWKIYSMPFEEDAPHNAVIRVNRETGAFLYSSSCIAARDFSCISDIPVESLEISTTTQLVSIAGPDYGSLKFFGIHYVSPITNLMVLSAASNLETLIIHETPVTSLDFVERMTNIATIAVQGAPIRDFTPVERLWQKTSPKRTNDLVVSLRYTLGKDFDCLEKYANGKTNVRLVNERERLPLWFVRSYGWDKFLSKELIALCEREEDDKEDVDNEEAETGKFDE